MKPGLRFVLSLLIFAGVATGSTMYSVAKFNDAKDARIAADTGDNISVDSIYDDRIESKYDPNYDTGRYERIATSLESDPVFVGAYRTLDVDAEGLDAIRDKVEDLDVPIYVAFVSNTELDDADGDVNLIAARIAVELSAEKATVAVFGDHDEGIGDKGVVRDIDMPTDTTIDATNIEVASAYADALRSAEMEDALLAYSSTVDEEGQPVVVEEEDPDDDPRILAYPGGASAGGIALGLLVGGALGVGGVMIRRTTRKRQRNT